MQYLYLGGLKHVFGFGWAVCYVKRDQPFLGSYFQSSPLEPGNWWLRDVLEGSALCWSFPITVPHGGEGSLEFGDCDLLRPYQHRTRDATRNAMEANGTCWCKLGCPHSTQATSKDLHSNFRARVLCGLALTRACLSGTDPKGCGSKFQPSFLRGYLKVRDVHPIQEKSGAMSVGRKGVACVYPCVGYVQKGVARRKRSCQTKAPYQSWQDEHSHFLETNTAFSWPCNIFLGYIYKTPFFAQQRIFLLSATMTNSR